MDPSYSNIIFEGILLKEQEQIGIICLYASVASLYVKFTQGDGYQKGTEFDSCHIKIKGKDFQFGACRFEPERHVPDFDGRLIFTDNVYDFHSTINNEKLLDKQAYFQGLPLMLGQKESIKPEFRSYLTELSYDLSVYKKIFDDIDFKYRNEPSIVFDSLQKVIIESEGDSYFKFFNAKLDELNRIVTDFTREEHSLHGFYLRRQLWNFISSSKFILRSNVRPRGYPGDSMMMSLIYEKKYVGDSTFGKLMHYHPIQTRTAQAVRNRRHIVPRHIFDAYRDFNPLSGKYRILSLACGPAMELDNIILTQDDFKKYHFSLLDQDHEALFEASQSMRKIEDRFECQADYSLLCHSVRTMISVRDLAQHWGRFNFVYSMGLFDYISARVASVIIKKVYEVLEPGGIMLIGNFHVRNESRLYMDYWLDWTLNYRTESEFMSLTNGLENASAEIFFEETGNQMFLKIKKNR